MQINLNSVGLMLGFSIIEFQWERFASKFFWKEKVYLSLNMYGCWHMVFCFF